MSRVFFCPPTQAAPQTLLAHGDTLKGRPLPADRQSIEWGLVLGKNPCIIAWVRDGCGPWRRGRGGAPTAQAPDHCQSVPNRRASQSKNRVRRLENSGFRGHRQPVLVAHMVALMGTLGQRGRARKVGDASAGWIDFVGGIEAGGHALVGSVAQQPLFLRGRRGRFRTRRRAC